MVANLAHNLIGRIHEKLVGRRTFSCLSELERSQWSSPQDVRAAQRNKLRALLLHAYENVAFYRDRLKQIGANPWIDDPRAILERMPFLQRDDIRLNRQSLVWQNCPGGLHPYNTGGSTGEPIMFFFDRRRQAYDQAARIRSHRWFGVDLGDREVFLWGSPIETGGHRGFKKWRDWLLNQFILDAFRMSPDRIRRYWELLGRLRPSCLFGYPSSLALLAESRPATFGSWQPRAIFVTGEVCYPHHRKLLEEVFDAPVADGYGSREAGFIAHQCPEGGMHITAENVIVEIMGPKGPSEPGTSGEIVITHLDAYAMPFIRYRTGDHGRLREGRCACGRGLPLMEVIEGRSTDFLQLPDGTIKHALSVIYPIRSTKGVRRFRVIQQADGSVDVNYEASGEEGTTASTTTIELEKQVRHVLEEQVPVRAEPVKEIPPSGSGKFRYVISHATPNRRHDSTCSPS
ncbi:MAG: phenylacetate--CoA ligase family protein [Phycisphaerae bacterium]